MTSSNAPQLTPLGVPDTSPFPYKAHILTSLGAWTAVTLKISIPSGLNNVHNFSPFDTEF